MVVWFIGCRDSDYGHLNPSRWALERHGGDEDVKLE